MGKRFIAVVVLAALALGTVPFGFASAARPVPATVEKSAESGSEARDHSCCPSVHSQFVLPVVMPSPAEMPCEQHPCCAKQAPQHQPALPAARTTTRPGSEGVPVSVVHHDYHRTNLVSEVTGNNPRESYSVRSTVLRI